MMKQLLVFALTIFHCALMAQTPQSCPCATQKHRQFDFWIGDWEVKDSSGAILGHNLIELKQDSCTLQENWKGAKGFTGTSLSFYNRSTDQWHQTWIDQFGQAILMDGGLEEGGMVMYTKPHKAAKSGKMVQDKTSWTPLKDGRVKHVWERSSDEGKTWRTVFKGYYSRRK